MDWFERITGFREGSYAETQARLAVREERLHADGVDRGFQVGRLEILSLASLRERVASSLPPAKGRLKCSVLQADVRKLHEASASRGALFQVASQFNLLEMVGPDVTPEDGVTRYAGDPTQGPACAIAAGAGTIFRNYLVPLAGGIGQGGHRQVDCLAGLGAALGNEKDSLWQMRNGYALATTEGLRRVDAALQQRDEKQLDALRALLQVGVQWDVQVTLPGADHLVTQVYCSALPVSYCRAPTELWRGFATLVLEAGYEATLLAAVLNAASSGSSLVYLTRLGGGAFGNATEWIHAAMARAIGLVRERDLDVRVVSHGAPDEALVRWLSRVQNQGS